MSRWCFFHDLLITALQRTVAFAQRYYLSLPISKNLNFDMTGFIHKAFQKHPCIFKELLAQTFYTFISLLKCLGIITTSQANSATTCCARSEERRAGKGR